MKKELSYTAMKVGIAVTLILSTQIAVDHPILAFMGYCYSAYLLDRFAELAVKGTIVK